MFTYWLQRLSWPIRQKLTGSITGQTVVLDYLKIENAKITGCHILYHGGPVHMVNVSIENSASITFGGNAANTLAVMKLFDSDSNEVLRKTFNSLGDAQ